MGPALQNIDNLIQMPTGCGEQTMIGKQVKCEIGGSNLSLTFVFTI